MSQTPLDVSGKLHAEPAELDEEESSDAQEAEEHLKQQNGITFSFFGYHTYVIIK